MSERAIIAAEGALLEPGDSIRTLCPFCRGGRSNETSMAVTRADDGAILFICHRAGCGSRGSIGGGPVVRKPEKRLPAPRPLDTGRLTEVPPMVGALVAGEWHMPVPRGWSWHEKSQMIAMPVLDQRGRIRGHILRLPPTVTTNGPKCLTFKEKVEEPWLHWASVRGRSLFVVEDVPSAERLALRGHSAVAILGSYISDEAMLEIVGAARNIADACIHVSLDRDAQDKARQYLASLSLLYEKVKVLVPYPKDFKNLTEEELDECLKQT